MRVPATGTAHRPNSHGLTAVVLLAFVILLAIGFWAGAAWIGQTLLVLAAA